ncbi:MAG: hypothetical protein ABL959_15855 [Pyrinomonadaceae bacterium]
MEQEKEFVIAAVLDLETELRTLEYIGNRQRQSENQINDIVFDTFGALIYPMCTSIWHNAILKLYWLYDEKGQRGLRWFCGTLESPNEATIRWKEAIDVNANELQKVRKFRDKWVAHRDKQASENPTEFWKDKERMTLKEARPLLTAAKALIEQDVKVMDATEFGIPKIFEVIDFLVQEYPESIQAMKQKGIISFHEPQIW